MLRFPYHTPESLKQSRRLLSHRHGSSYIALFLANSVFSCSWLPPQLTQRILCFSRFFESAPALMVSPPLFPHHFTKIGIPDIIPFPRRRTKSIMSLCLITRLFLSITAAGPCPGRPTEAGAHLSHLSFFDSVGIPHCLS